MPSADTCAAFIAVPIAWLLMTLKRVLPGTRSCRYTYMIALPRPQQPERRTPRLARRRTETEGQTSDPVWLPAPYTEHEHYTH